MRIALLLLSLAFLSAADGCPLTVGDPPAQGGGTGSGSGTSLDVGGQSGALWQLAFDKDVLVTLRLASGQAGSKRVPLHGGIADVLDATIAVSDFCFRTDLVCPQAVLAEQTAIQQPSTGGLLIGFNHRGPLAAIQDKALAGSIAGQELSVPLAVGNAAQGYCALGSNSAVLASAYASNGARADSLQGRVTVAYDGRCALLGGATVPADSRIELSVGFAGKRP